MSEQTETITAATVDVKKPLVLVVDDDSVSRKLMRRTLQRESFAVVEAENGEQALTVFDEYCPDIVLLDVEMPVMDGFTACMKLRERKIAEHIPVLMVTGLDDTASVNRAYDAGATDFITKPLHWPILGHRIRYLLRSSETVAKLAYTVGQLDDSRIRLTNAQRIAQLGNWEIDTESMVMSWSEEVYRILGLDPQCSSPSVAALLDVVHEEDREQVRHWFSLALKTGDTHSINHRVLGPKGSLCNVFQQVGAVVDADGSVIELQGTIQDLTERQKFEDKIRELAYFDSLTGLPNRNSFMMHVLQSIKSAKRHQEKLAALFLDLDDFKRINDTLGHSAGDLLIKIVAQRLEECLRCQDVVAREEGDAVSHMVSRFGGDEFTILLQDLRDNEDAAVVAQRILQALSRPLNLAGHEIVITPTIGIAVFPEDGDNREILFRNADAAMYSAKRSGKNSFRFYDNHMNAQARERLTMENQLRKALERNELALHYQPQLDIDSGEIIGVEALLRWNSEELGNVPPDDFIPLAEDSGLIHPIGEWVLRTACAQVKAWQDTGVPIRRVAVNISARQFARRDFLQLINQVLDDTGLAPESLELEITESLLMQDMEGAIATMNKLKQLGVLLAIDDFGTGYSSLSYLKRFPIDRLKVDRSFIHELTTNAEDAAITMALIAMADTLDLRVIAEGVETKEQLVSLTEKCCHEIQGYYLSRPVPAHEISSFVKAISGENPKPHEALDRRYIN
jgi:diguanylate cyclase (GGDEF)-like protein/PAS domain S-box-containing protein